MQFKNKATLIYNSFNDFGEPVQESTAEIRCAIVEQTKKRTVKAGSTSKDFDLNILVQNKGYGAYTHILSYDNLLLQVDGQKYTIEEIHTINDTSGRAKYFDIYLAEAN